MHVCARADIVCVRACVHMYIPVCVCVCARIIYIYIYIYRECICARECAHSKPVHMCVRAHLSLFLSLSLPRSLSLSLSRTHFSRALTPCPLDDSCHNMHARAYLCSTSTCTLRVHTNNILTCTHVHTFAVQVHAPSGCTLIIYY